jgi:hypothetical protein
VVHLLNGDATAAVMPGSIEGERVVWRDIMMEGPPVADGARRGAWLAPRLGIGADAYVRGWDDEHAALSRAREHDEIVLWFEQDLFCAVNLWYVIEALAATPTRISLVFPPLGEGFDGLGRLGAAEFEPLLERRAVLDDRARAAARAFWRAYASPDPMALVTLGAGPPAVPFMARAVRLHCGRFPSVAHGLDEVETAALETLASQGPLAFGALFAAVTRRRELRELGMGDVQLAWRLRDLAAGSDPLVSIDDGADPFERWRVAVTAAGTDTLAGHPDRLAYSPAERWIGGVHVTPSRSGWRWNRAAGRLVPPTAG